MAIPRYHGRTPMLMESQHMVDSWLTPSRIKQNEAAGAEHSP